jgi:hypothetical protein
MVKIATKFAPNERAFLTACDAGFRCAELWLDDGVLRDWRGVAALAQRFGLEHVLHFPNQKQLSRETLQQAVELYKALECPCMVIHRPMFEAFGETLRSLHPTIRLAVENHRESPEGLHTWAETNPGLTLDVEHVWKFTLHDCPLDELLTTLRGLLERHAAKVHHVHLPGYLPGWKEHCPMYYAREMVFPVLSLLEKFHFTGFAVSEVEIEFQTVNDLRMDLLLFDTWRLQS